MRNSNKQGKHLLNQRQNEQFLKHDMDYYYLEVPSILKEVKKERKNIPWDQIKISQLR